MSQCDFWRDRTHMWTHYDARIVGNPPIKGCECGARIHPVGVCGKCLKWRPDYAPKTAYQTCQCKETLAEIANARQG